MKRLAKIITVAFLIFNFQFLTFSSYAQNIGINTTGATPDVSTILDLNTGSNYASPNGKGLLIPNVSLANTTDAVTIGTPAASLLVYNTNAAMPDGKGFYYNAGTTVAPNWVRFMSGTTSTDWKLTGNTGTTVGTNFLGTIDAQDFAVYTNNLERMLVTSAGFVGIGIAVPQANLHVVGAVFVTQPGNLQWGKIANGGLTLYRDQTGTFTNDNGFIDFKYLAAHQNDTRIRYNHSLGTNGALEFLSNTDGISANSTSKMVILNSNGNVGIGTTNPASKLNVVMVDNTTANQMLRITRSGTGATGNGFFFTHGATATDYNAITGAGDIGMFFDIDGNPAASSSTKGLVIAPWANGGTPGAGTGIKIQENGFVGIGTSNPGEQFTIGVNNFVFHNGGDKAIGFNCDWTPANQWSKITGSVYQGRIHFNPTTGDLGFISSSVATGLNNLVDNKLFIEGGTGSIGIGTVAPTKNLHITDPVAPVIKLEEVDATTEWDLVADGGSFSIRRNNLYAEAYPLTILSSNKNIGISTINPSATLSVNGTANKTGGGSWAIFSDKRLKKDINDFNLGLKTLLKVHAINFKYNDKYFNLFGENEEVRNITYQGVIAQELQKIAPFMVSKKSIEILNNKGEITTTEEVLEVDPSAFTYMLINAVQELQQENETLKKEMKLIKLKLGL